MQISKIIVGAMRLGKWGAGFSLKDYERFIDACLDMGIQDFDHADIYGGYTTEEEFGHVIRQRPDLKSKLRVTTKCGIMMPSEGVNKYPLKYYDSTAKHIVSSVDSSLEKLGLEKIDLLLLHRPDYWLQAEEVASAVQKLKERGKVLHFGVSNYSRDQMAYLASCIDIEMNQLEISVSETGALDDGSFDYCRQNGIRVAAWSPLGGGDIFTNHPSPRMERIKNAALDMARKYDCRLDQVLVSWLSSHPFGIIPVTGTSKIERVESALKATQIEMERTDWYALLEASKGHEVP